MQLERGDPADIVQCVRWQEQLYAITPALNRLEAAAQVRGISHAFVQAFAERRASSTEYPGLMRALLQAFGQTALSLPGLRLAKYVAAIALHIDDITPLQKAHRDYLMALERGLNRRVNHARRRAAGI